MARKIWPLLFVYILFLAPEIQADSVCGACAEICDAAGPTHELCLKCIRGDCNNCKSDSQAFQESAKTFKFNECEHQMKMGQQVKECYKKRDYLKTLADTNVKNNCAYLENKICNDGVQRKAQDWKTCLSTVEKIINDTDLTRPEKRPGVRPSGTR